MIGKCIGELGAIEQKMVVNAETLDVRRRLLRDASMELGTLTIAYRILLNMTPTGGTCKPGTSR
jgi:hypothetical protein